MTNKEKLREVSRKMGYEAITENLKNSMNSLKERLDVYYEKDLEKGKYLYNPWDGYMPDDSSEYENVVEELARLKFAIDQLEFMLSCELKVDNLEDSILNDAFLKVYS